MVADGLEDALGGAAVAVGVDSAGHGPVGGGVVQQAGGGGENILLGGADELDGTGLDCFRAFGKPAQDEQACRRALLPGYRRNR